MYDVKTFIALEFSPNFTSNIKRFNEPMFPLTILQYLWFSDYFW